MSRRLTRSASRLASEADQPTDEMAPQEVLADKQTAVITAQQTISAEIVSLAPAEEASGICMEVDPPAVRTPEPGPSGIRKQVCNPVGPVPFRAPSPVRNPTEAGQVLPQTGNAIPMEVVDPVPLVHQESESGSGDSMDSDESDHPVGEITPRPARDLRRRVPKHGEGNPVKYNVVGDHSVEAHIPDGAATFIQHYVASFQNIPNVIRFHQDAFTLSSYLLQAETSSNYRNQVRVESAILLTTKGPQPEDRMRLLHVHLRKMFCSQCGRLGTTTRW